MKPPLMQAQKKKPFASLDFLPFVALNTHSPSPLFVFLYMKRHVSLYYALFLFAVAVNVLPSANR